MTIVAAHLCLLPWALGTMWWQTQVGSWTLSLAGFCVAVGNRGKVLTLRGLVPFWAFLGLAMFALIEGLNPAWRFGANDHIWWLTPLAHVRWLPSGMSVPFERAGPFRQAIVWSDSALLVGSMWVGISRRRTIFRLLLIVAINGLALAILSLVQFVTDDYTIPWAPGPWHEHSFIATFAYHNHAGAYFVLMTFLLAAISLRTWEVGTKAVSRSTPAGLWALAAGAMMVVVAFTLSRAATLIDSAGMVVLGLWFVFVRPRMATGQTESGGLLVLGGVVAAAILAIATRIDFSAVSGRMESLLAGTRDYAISQRLLARKAASMMLHDFWLTGVGAGDFRFLFPWYAKNFPPIYDQGRLYWDHAHWDWIEFPIDWGLTGDLILATALFWCTRRLLVWKCWQNYFAAPLVLSSLTTLVHAWVDFPFQCPAISLTWWALLISAIKWMQLTHAPERC